MSENEITVRVSGKNDFGKTASDVKRDTADMTSGFDRAGEAADGAEGKAQGFSDTLTGTADVMAGVGEIAKGNLFEGLVTAGTGVADLAGGMATFLIPALSKVSIGSVKARAANLAQAAATRVLTIAQRGLNLAMRANPIGLVITAITLLVGAFLLLWRRSEAFRNFWIGLWNRIKTIAGGAKDWIVERFQGMLDFFRGLPGKIGGFFRGLAGIITAPYRAAFSAIKSLWNSTVGGFGFSVPDWVPGVGGKSFTIPEMARGGIHGGLAIVGERGRELVRLPSGSQVIPNGTTENMLRRGGGRSDRVVLEIHSGRSRLDELLVEILREAIRVRGGNVQVVLGRGTG